MQTRCPRDNLCREGLLVTPLDRGRWEVLGNQCQPTPPLAQPHLDSALFWKLPYSRQQRGCFQGPRPCLSYSGVSSDQNEPPALSPQVTPTLEVICRHVRRVSAYTGPEEPEGNGSRSAGSTRTCSRRPLFTAR